MGFKVKSYHMKIYGVHSMQFAALDDANNLIGSCLMHFDTCSTFVQDVHVSDEWQRKGVASAMISGCMMEACKADTESITVRVNRGNVSAIEFWKALRFFICDQYASDYIMTRPLNGAWVLNENNSDRL